MKQLLVIICVMFAFASCYKDEGNYTYRFDSMNNIDSISFVPEAYTTINGPTIEFQQPLKQAEKKRVEAKLTQSLSSNLDNLEFNWIRSYTNEKGRATRDTLHTKGYVELDLPKGRNISYSILLQIYDKSTTLSKYATLTVRTRPIFQNSLFVLHAHGGVSQLGNIEVIGKESHVVPNAYKEIYPDNTDNPFRKAVGLVYTTAVSLDMYNRADIVQSLGILNRDGTSLIYDPFGLKEKRNLGSGYVLPQPEAQNPPFVYKKLICTGDISSTNGYKCLLSKDGRFYTAQAFIAFQVPGKDVEKDPLNLSPSQYHVTAATIAANYMILWDSKGQRFIYTSKSQNYYPYGENEARMNAYMSAPVLEATVKFNNVPSELLPYGKEAVYAYTAYRENYESAPSYFIFKDAEGNYYRYELTMKQNGKTKALSDKKEDGKDDGKGESTSFSAKVIELPYFSPSDDNMIVYSSFFSTDYVFYAEGGSVYRYNMGNGDRTLIYTAPTGYTISVLKTRSDDSGVYSGDLGRWLCIGMNKGEEGAVAEVKLSQSADVEAVYPSTKNVYEGFGKIIDLQFANEYNYYTPDYVR